MNRLAQCRKDKGYSQQSLSDVLEVSQKTIASWETGRTVPSPARMQQLEDILGRKKEEIFFDDFNYKM